MTKDNALAFVGQIMTAYKAVVKAEGQALKHAIECGVALNLAKENVESTKPKGIWKAWLAEHCPEIKPRTERLSRQLASAIADDPDIFADCDSIRSAVEKLNGSDDADDAKDEASEDDRNADADEDKQSGNALPPRKSASDFEHDDLTSMLENCAVDEIGKALADADKLDEFQAATISRLTPEKVCEALAKAWNVDQLRDLSKRLGDHLSTIGPGDLSIPKGLRRPLSAEVRP
jgi:hypothetical protein